MRFCSKIDDTVNSMIPQDLLHFAGIPDIAFYKSEPFFLVQRKGLKIVQVACIRKVVQTDYLIRIVAGEPGVYKIAPDKTCNTSYQKFHAITLSLSGTGMWHPAMLGACTSVFPLFRSYPGPNIRRCAAVLKVLDFTLWSIPFHPVCATIHRPQSDREQCLSS